MKKHLFLLAYLSLGALGGFSQSVAINTDGSKPDPNAIVDVKSTTKGVLLPRMTSAQRLAISNTRGLLLYDTDDSLYWYNDGKQWQSFFTADLFKKDGNSWLLTGNNQTVDKVNFIGTKDNVPLNIRVNNQPSGRIDPTRQNTYWGYQSGANTTGERNTANGYKSMFTNTKGSSNTAFGLKSLFSNTTGYSNVAIGVDALYTNYSVSNMVAVGDSALYNNGMGFENTAVGSKALYSNTDGTDNSAFGFNALLLNKHGIFNTAIGYNALYTNNGNYNTATGNAALSVNTTGYYNVADGSLALSYNSTGYANTADGNAALQQNVTGFNNTASGTYSLTLNHTGNNNTADGYLALYFNMTGSNLTAIGANSGVSGDGLNNATAIGADTYVNASNKIRLGNPAVTVIEGQVPFTTPSDGRFKFNIQENVRGLDFILKLRPVTYQFDVKKQEGFTRGAITPGQLNNYVTSAGNDEATQMIRTGFIAQEVEQAAKKTGYDFDGVKAPRTEREYYSLSYSSFVVPLVKAVQEQEEIIQTLKKRISELEQLINQMDDKKMEEQNIRIKNLEQELAEINKSLKVLH